MPAASSSVAAPLRLRLLGAGGAWLEGRAVTFGTRKMLAVLAVLALEGAVTRSKLAGLLWSDNAEDEARRNLRRELHRLREAGLRHHFAQNGEQLSLRFYDCDALELDAALREGDSARALTVCGDGELLEDTQLENADGFLSWLEDQRLRYRQATQRALTLESERLETRGDWRGAMALQQRLLRLNPLQERTHRDLMRLHAQLGERERSLEVYANLKRALRQELGLEPLPETVNLARALQGGMDAAPTEPTDAPRAAAQRTPLVGRDAEARLLEMATGTILVTGEAGIGKTRLVQEVAPRATIVRFTEVGARTPLYAIAQTLRSSWSQPEGRARLQALEAVWKHDLARLLPEVDERSSLEAIPDALGRARFLEALARGLATLGEPVVFEDVHWADDLSWEVIADLAQRERLILTARADELRPESAFSRWLRDLETAGGLTRLSLEPLSESALAELSACFVTDDPRTDPHVLAARLHRDTRGNPLFALETLKFALERSFSEALTLPPTLRETVLGRVKRLGEAVWRLLETASLAGRGFRLSELQSATALNEWEALEGLERAVGAGLLEHADGGWAFHHDLIRAALEENLSAERAALIHRLLAQALEAQSAAPERIAHHLERSGQGVRAVAWRVRAARAATAVYAHREALEQYALASQLSTDLEQTFEIVEATTLLHYALGQPEERQAAVERLEALGTRPHLHARARVARVTLEYDLGRYANALRLAESPLEAKPEADQLEALLLYASVARMRLGQLNEADAGLERGLALALERGSKRAGEFRLYRATVATYQGRYADAQQFNDAILDAERTGDWVELDAIVNQGRFAVMLGDEENGLRQLRAALERARALHSDSMIRFALLGLTGALNQAWAWQEALPLVLENLERSRQARHKVVEIVMLDRLAETQRLAGNLGAALSTLHQARAETEAAQATGSRVMIAESFATLYLDVGDATRARAELRAALEQAERETAAPSFTPIWTGLARAARLDGNDHEARTCATKARAHWHRSPACDRRESQFWWQLVHAKPLENPETASNLAAHLRTATLELCTNPTPRAVRSALALLQQNTAPLIETLELRRALRPLLENTPRASGVEARTRAVVTSLAQSLETHPDEQRCFLQRHPI